MKRIIYQNSEGGVAVIIPTESVELALKDVPEGVAYKIVEDAAIPSDRYFRNAWVADGAAVAVDLGKAKSIGHDIRRTFRRPDFVAVLNPNRQNKGAGFKMGSDLSLQKEQIDVMQDAKGLIQEIPRIYSTQLGNAPTGVTSGSSADQPTSPGTAQLSMRLTCANASIAREI